MKFQKKYSFHTKKLHKTGSYFSASHCDAIDTCANWTNWQQLMPAALDIYQKAVQQ
jgi:hypothetical protein